jgi:hypothetical protein
MQAIQTVLSSLSYVAAVSALPFTWTYWPIHYMIQARDGRVHIAPLARVGTIVECVSIN